MSRATSRCRRHLSCALWSDHTPPFRRCCPLLSQAESIAVGPQLRHVRLGSHGSASRTQHHGNEKHAMRGSLRLGRHMGENGTTRSHIGRGGASRRGWSRTGGFEDILQALLKSLETELMESSLITEYLRGRTRSGSKQKPLRVDRPVWATFTETLSPSKSKESIWQDLYAAFSTGGKRVLEQRIRYQFCRHVLAEDRLHVENQKALADLRYPAEWYPATRAQHRKVHLHVGPTNSGKTYQALQRLEQANSGVYAGPLRLLAHEVYSRMNAKGLPCMLLTGEERRSALLTEEGEQATPATRGEGLMACTVEMVPLNRPLEVAVIDEIQMIGNKERGWAWTAALLGVRSAEVHLCGEERTVPLIREICAAIGDELHVHQYQRLSPLKTADSSLQGNLKNLRKGDCIVSFSVMGIHALRRQIERATGKKVATVYGSLPPETRAQQARLFNDPDNDYDYLVASDAVGMGLNLAIRRMIFETVTKFDGHTHRVLPIADIKQIAGRAGRFRVAGQTDQDLSNDPGHRNAETRATNTTSDTNGIVTTLETYDLPIVQRAMKSDPEPIRSAGVQAPWHLVDRFATYFPPGTPFSYILTRLHELSLTHTRFHLCRLHEQLWIADVIEPIRALTVADRFIFSAAPAHPRDPIFGKLLPALARCVAEQQGGNILDIPELPLEILDLELSASREYLRELESLHKGVGLYLWLSYRFPGIFRTRAVAFHIKDLVEAKIAEVLGKFSFSEKVRRKMAEERQRAVLMQEELFHDIESAVASSPSAERSEGLDGLESAGDELGKVLDVVDVEGHDQGSADGQTPLLTQVGIRTGSGDIEHPDTERQSEAGAAEHPSTLPPKHFTDLNFSNTDTKHDEASRL